MTGIDARLVQDLVDELPRGLQGMGPYGVLWWQWFALWIVGALSYLGGTGLGRLSGAFVKQLAERTSVMWDDELVEVIQPPLRFAWAALVWWLLLPSLALQAKPQLFADKFIDILLVVLVFWCMSRLVSVALSLLGRSEWSAARPGSKSVLSVGGRAARVAIVIFAVISLLSLLGFPVGSLLTGLGLGGLAIGLAAQKSLENLFGGVSIAVDQPLREGDYVDVEGSVSGTVEVVGLRSTRIRTLDRTLVSIPNGKLADSRIESFTVRDRSRLSCTLGLVYATSSQSLRNIMVGLETVLKAHPLIWPDRIIVRFSEFGASSLDIEVMAWFETTQIDEFREVRQEILLAFMEVVEKNGSSFAFPSRTVHLVNEAQAA